MINPIGIRPEVTARLNSQRWATNQTIVQVASHPKSQAAEEQDIRAIRCRSAMMKMLAEKIRSRSTV
jgi:hypothetical protein